MHLFPMLLRKRAPCITLSKAVMLQVSVMKKPDKPVCPLGWKGLEEAVSQPSIWAFVQLGCTASFPWSGDRQKEAARGMGQSGLGERNSTVAYFSPEKFENTPNPPGFPWTHPLLPSGIEGVQKFACCFKAGFAQIFLRSPYVADMQARVIAVAGMRLSDWCVGAC